MARQGPGSGIPRSEMLDRRGVPTSRRQARRHGRGPLEFNERQTGGTMKRVLLRIAVAAVAAMGMAHTASADALDDIKKAGKIRIAIDLAVPPYGLTPAQMQPTPPHVPTTNALAQ